MPSVGVDYTSEPDDLKSKFTFAHDVGISFSGSATTDGGLSFGASVGFDNKTGGGSFDDGSVSVSGAFGTVSIGDVGRGSDLAGGIADIGLNGVGVDDVVEDMRETNEKQLRYENSFGQISIAFSAGTKDGTAAVPGTPRVAEVDATEWTVVNHLNVKTTYTDVPSPAQYNGLFAITRTQGPTDEAPTAITADPDGDATASAILGHGYFGDPDDDGIRQISADPTADTPTAVTDEDIIAAFEHYRTAYDLGDDMRVGGGDDTRLEGVVMDNSEPAIPAMPGTPATSSDTQYGFGMSFNASGVTIGLGYDSEKTVSMGAGFGAGDIGTNLLYVKQDDGNTGIGADLSYTMDASTLTLAWARGEKGGASMDAMGAHVSHDLGGGASLVAGFGQVDDVNKASMGLSFSF